LFVATRMPPQMAVFDTNSGRLVAALPTVQDADDLYYDSARKRVYIPGGEGYISVFQQDDADHYKLLVKIQSALGARTAGYFGKGRKGFDRFYLAVPARADHGAEVRRAERSEVPGFSATIRKISSRTSVDSFFLPTCFLTCEIKLQSPNPHACLGLYSSYADYLRGAVSGGVVIR
jgi:hypothetical protein